MPSQSFRIGPAQVSIYTPNGSILPPASSVGFTAALINPTTLYLNSVKKALTLGTGYQVVWGYLGVDNVNGGYTVTVCSSAAPSVTPLSATPAIYMNIPAANLPAGAANTPAVAIFLKAGNGNYTLAEFAQLNVNSGIDFNHVITEAPLFSNPGNFTLATLQAATVDPTLGSRVAGGWSPTVLSPTTGGVTVTRSVTQVTVSPDNTADFQIVTTRTVQISFQLLANDVLNVIQGNAGSFVQYTSTNNGIIQEAQMSLNTAAALISGNNPMALLMPPDSSGNQEVRLYLGQLLQNQQQNTEDWKKDSTTPIGFTYSAVSIDKLTNSLNTEIIQKIGI
jgi:hypothetical protein